VANRAGVDRSRAITRALSFGLSDIRQLSSAMFGGETADNLNPLGIMRGRIAAPMFKGPIEADLVDAVGDPQPSNRRRAIWLWHPCVDVYVSNP
jgi:hypothetical protein